jgi:integrase
MIQEIIKGIKYKITVSYGYSGRNKKYKSERFYGGLRQAQLREAELKKQVQENTIAKKDTITFEQLINEWLEVKEKGLSHTTFVTYKRYCGYIINGVQKAKGIGNIKLKNLNVRALENFYNDLKTKTELADKTQLEHYRIISSCLNTAIRWEYISTNPNSKIISPKVHKKEMNYFSLAQIQLFYSALEKESLLDKTLLHFAIESGARRGEIMRIALE